MSYFGYYVERQVWAHWPKVLVMRRVTGNGPDEGRRYVPERTCKNIAESPRDGSFWPVPHFKCSVCGNGHVSMDYVYFCPNCGAKVSE